MKIAYFDPFSGASGNMILGAMLDAGLDQAALEEGLRRLDLGDWELRVRPVLKRSVGALYVEFLLRGESADYATTVPPGGRREQQEHEGHPHRPHEPGSEHEGHHGHQQHGPRHEHENRHHGHRHEHEHEHGCEHEHHHHQHGHRHEHEHEHGCEHEHHRQHGHRHEHEHCGHRHEHEHGCEHEHHHHQHGHRHEHEHHHHGHRHHEHEHGCEHEHHRHHGHRHEHHHDHQHRHREHDHDHAGEHQHGPGSLGQILERIRRSGLPEPVVERSCAAFRRLAEAEGRVHRTSAEDVQFHEVGAVDAILDVVGSVLGLHLMGVEEVYAGSLPHGHGFVRTAHGRLPLPAPATAFLTQGVPVRFVDVPGELVTPTGAALLVTLARFEAPPAFQPSAVGHGAGRSEYPHPNLLRLFVGETVEPGVRPSLASAELEGDAVSLEVNLDDMSPQLLGALMERLLAEGALDVAFAPLQMKKNRPGVQIQVLAPPELATRMADTLLAETTTLGVRWHAVRRRTLERREIKVETRYGPIRVKVAGEAGQLHRQPEFDDCRRAAEEHAVPVRLVHEAALVAAQVAGPP